MGLSPERGEHKLAGELLRRMGIDAALWAIEFDASRARIIARGEPDPVDNPTTGGWLHGWLCNAIEAGRSAGYGEGMRAQPDTSQALAPPAGWYRAPNAHDVIWARLPGGNHDVVIATSYDTSPELWEWLERVVPEGEPC